MAAVMDIVLKNYSGLLRATTCSGSRKPERKFNGKGIDLIEGGCEPNQRALLNCTLVGLQHREVLAGVEGASDLPHTLE